MANEFCIPHQILLFLEVKLQEGTSSKEKFQYAPHNYKIHAIVTRFFPI